MTLKALDSRLRENDDLEGWRLRLWIPAFAGMTFWKDDAEGSGFPRSRE